VADRAAAACVSLALLLDEMHAPVVAAKLRDRGHDVLAVAEQDDLRALTDEQLFRWASERDRRIVTENVKDFAPLLRRAEELRHHAAPLLFTSSRTFPRTQRNPGPMIDALDTWLRAAKASEPPMADWLQPA
jgi:hypothetical protein